MSPLGTDEEKQAKLAAELKSVGDLNNRGVDINNPQLKGRLASAVGLPGEVTPTEEPLEEVEGVGASHYCIHHGGVNHNGSITMRSNSASCTRC